MERQKGGRTPGKTKGRITTNSAVKTIFSKAYLYSKSKFSKK
jgi:hypothetical protein